MINKFYITDLAPGRSMIEYLVGQGHQVFVISWRNPDARHRDWDLDSYGAAIGAALGAVRSISQAPRASVCALCSGGVAAAMVAAHLSAAGKLGELATLCLGVTVLDQAQAGTAAAMIDRRTAALAMAASARRGYLDGRSLAEVFAWLRPNDLIWNYWVNNYLQGRTPPPFDILYWNADTTRLPAAVHRDFIEIALSNALTKPDEATMLGSPVDLSRSTSTPTSWPGSPITCAPGSPATAARSCSAAAPGSCCPPAGTSRPWSTRRPTARPPSRRPRTTRPIRGSGCGPRRPCRAAGGRTTRPGSPSAAAGCGTGRRASAARASIRSSPRRQLRARPLANPCGSGSESPQSARRKCAASSWPGGSCGSRFGMATAPAFRCCCSTASGPAWTCCSRSWTRSIRRSRSSGSTCRAWAARRCLPSPTGSAACAA